MRQTILVTALVIAGCAGQPSTPPPTRYVAAASQPVLQPTTPGGDIDAKRLVDAKKEGFAVVNTDGEVLYCRTELRTGSHVVKDTTCLTAKQLDDMHEQTRLGLQNSLKSLPPPQGR